MKMQIFTVLKEVIHTYKGRYRKEKLLALQRFYQFCAKHQVADIETMTLAKEQQFEQELSERFRGGKEKCCVWYPADEQKNPIFTGTGNSLECECVVFGTFPFFQRTNESKQARGMGIL